MEKRLHAFVRKHGDLGYTVSVLTHPHLAAFARDASSASADLGRVIARLLGRGELVHEDTFWPDLRLRRMELVVRAVQHARLLPVPMRFTVITHGVEASADAGASAAARRRKAKAREPIIVRLPRLGLEGRLEDPADLDAYVEELVRHHLYMVPLARLTEVSYTGEETIEPLIVQARPPTRAKLEAAAARAETRVPMPPGLSEATRRLSDDAKLGLLERAYQRDDEVAQLREAVTARRRASVLLIGPSGAGKTAIVHELVQRSLEGPPASAVEVYTTNGSRIVAGMRYLGEWQGRVQRIIESLRTRRAVLHFESLPELLATGSSADGLDVARHLLPSIEAGDIVLIVEATAEDVARAERTHAAFVQVLRAVLVPPLPPDKAEQALVAATSRIGRARKVKFAPAAMLRARELTERFGSGVAMPGGALDLLRAAAHLDGRAGREVGPADVTRAFTLRTGYPREIIDPSVPLDPDAVLARLRGRVIGQDAAMTLLANLVITLKTGLADPARPLGSFLLLGPTGVGKTESALALAEYLFGDDKRLARLDMSEYAAPGSAVRLVSDVSGHDGVLARRVREQPFGIVLLDEIEKADGSVHDLLLQVLGEGRLTDATGRSVSFKNTVVLLTSNLGADSAGRSLGFGDSTRASMDRHYLSAAAAFFRPELLNRYDQIVPYSPLSADTVQHIAQRALASALEREGLTRRGVSVDVDPAAVTRLAAIGFDPRYGARPLKRAIEHWVIGPLARILAAGTPPRRLRLRATETGVAIDIPG